MRRITFGTAVLAMCWIGLAEAQQQPESTPEPAHKVYVLTGCLEGDTAATSAFKLTDGSVVGQAPPVRSSSSGGREASGEYLLQPVSGVGDQGISREGLQSHVGARVEVTVRPVEVLRGTPSSASTESKDKPNDAAPERYTVIKISRVAGSCA
jgi:hypothetical protein